jgi:cell division protein FtsL
VESQNYLGIYLSRDTATVVCLNLLGRIGKVLGSFSVSVEENEQANMQALAGLIAQGCAQRRWSYSEVSVALDCAIFMQHSVHSEFGDPKQIAATIRFDTEEALATDITNIALAFEITSAGQDGSELTVFTAQRKILSELLESLQAHNLDPVNIEPDVSCLSRFVYRKGPSAESQQPGTLFGILSRRNGYLIIPPVSAGAESQKASTVRTFLVGSAQNRGELLSREVLVTTALVKSGEPIHYLKVFDSAGTVNHQQLGEKLGIESDGIGLLDEAGAEKQIPDDGFKPVDYAIAYGAALAHSEKGHRVNFRDDFSPFQGKKLKMQQALKFAAISVTVLLIAVGLFFQAKLMSRNKDNRKLNAKFAENYSSVMLGQKAKDIKSAVKKLGTEKRRLEEAKKGLFTIKGEQSISSKLTLVLTAFNKCAAQTNLNIKTITIAAKDIIVTGDTSSRQNTLKFIDTLRNNGLEVLRQNFDIKGTRDNFNITLSPK